MKSKTKWYWDQTNQQQVFVAPPLTFVNPCLGVIVVKDLQYIKYFFAIENNHSGIYEGVLYSSLTQIMTILSMKMLLGKN